MNQKVTLVGLVEAACALILFGTIAGFLGSVSWVLELFDHFRLHYLIGAVVLGGGAWWLSRHRWALVCLVIALINLYLCPSVWPSGGVALQGSGETAHVRVATINVHTSNRNHADALQMIRDESPDVLLLLEVDAFWWVGLSELLDDYRVLGVNLRSDNFGIAMLVKPEFTGPGRIFYPGQFGLPAIQATLSSTNGATFDVIGIHPTPPASLEYRNENRRILREVAGMVKELTHPVILLGDLNTTPWSGSFRRLLDETGLVDTARNHGYLATWPTLAAPILRIPLDHCLVTPNIQVEKRWLGAHVGSDHLPLLVDLHIPITAP
ncbi:MAG TPA: endonuclease/exonuclease/phosphatase family protein [Kiritimatiellia bacterium]|nr:endonuclease/exonuclease/phosphatase family protein [Kiritimatiellia bacterium]